MPNGQQQWPQRPLTAEELYQDFVTRGQRPPSMPTQGPLSSDDLYKSFEAWGASPIGRGDLFPQPREGITPKEARRIGMEYATRGLNIVDKFVVKYGERVLRMVRGLPFIGKAIVPEEPMELPTMGIAGVVGGIIPDLALFWGLGGAARAVGAGAKYLRLGRIPGKAGQTLMRETSIGMAYGALTEEDRLKGALFHGAIFGGLTGVSIGARVGIPTAIKRRGLRRNLGDYMAATRDDIAAAVEAGKVDARAIPKAVRGVAREARLSEFAPAMTDPLGAQAARGASLQLEFDLLVRGAAKPQKAAIDGMVKRFQSLGWNLERVRDYLEAFTGERTTANMLKEGADELLINLKEYYRVSKMLKAAKVPEAMDPLFVSQVTSKSAAAGLGVHTIPGLFLPFQRFAAAAEDATGIPIRAHADKVTDDLLLSVQARKEFWKRSMIATGEVDPAVVTEVPKGLFGYLRGERRIRRYAREIGELGRQIDPERNKVLVAWAAAEELAPRAVLNRAKGRIVEAARRYAGATTPQARKAVGPELGRARAAYTELTAGRTLKPLNEFELDLWKRVEKAYNTGRLDEVLLPHELRWGKWARDALGDMRVHINSLKLLNREGKVIFFPDRKGYFPMMLDDLNRAYGDSKASAILNIDDPSWAKMRRYEMETFATDPVKIMQRYITRYSKLITMENSVREMGGFIKELRNVRLAREARGIVSGGKNLDDLATWWLERAWGVPTKSDISLSGNIKRLADALHIPVKPTDDMLAIASMIRDTFYTGLMGLRIPFHAGRNITQAPLLSSAELEGFSWLGMGYIRGLREVFMKDGWETMVTSGAVPAYAPALDILPTAATGKLAEMANRVARVRDISMIPFALSDRLNRVAAFWGSVEKWEHYERRIPSAKRKPEESQLEWFERQVGLNHLWRSERDIIRREMKAATQKGNLLVGDPGRATVALERAKYKWAAMVSNKTQFAYATAGSPLVMRTVAGKLLFQFSTWPMYYGGFLTELMKRPGKSKELLRMFVAVHVAADYLRFIEYDPWQSTLLGPFLGSVDKTEWGDYAFTFGPAVGASVNLMASAFKDANAFLTLEPEAFEPGALKNLETWRAVRRTIDNLWRLPADVRRAQRMATGEQRTFEGRRKRRRW